MSDLNQHLDEGTIHAWLDGALSPDESARVEAHVNSCPECAALVAEARGLMAASSRILSSLDAVPAGVLPGSERITDQLAVLRARRAATNRRWWQDRRVLAAASVVLVAGISSVVWRSSGVTSTVPEVPPAVVDAVTPASGAPRELPQPGASREAAIEAKAEALPILRDPRPMRVVGRAVADSAVDMKVAANPAGSRARDTGVAANEARLQNAPAVVAASPPPSVDSTSGAVRADQTAELRRQVSTQQGAAQQRQVSGQQGAAPQRFAVEQSRLDSARVAAPAAASVGAGNRLSAKAAADAAPADRCYQIRLVSPPLMGRTSLPGIDTVSLLDERLPVRSDPSWFLARARGALGDSLAWRQVDSITVELRSRVASDSLVVRFTTTAMSLADVRDETGVRAAVAVRVGCRE